MRLRASLLATVTVVATACSPSGSPPTPTVSAPSSSIPVTPSSTAQPPPPGLETLDHLIFIVQENRSFDHYFGSFPGADGIKFRAAGSP
jgi:phospholipase C